MEIPFDKILIKELNRELNIKNSIILYKNLHLKIIIETQIMSFYVTSFLINIKMTVESSIRNCNSLKRRIQKFVIFTD